MTVDAPLPLLDFEDQTVERQLPPLALSEADPLVLPPLPDPVQPTTAAPDDAIAKRRDSKTGMLAGAGLAATGVLLAQLPSTPAPHEGKFQLIVESSAHTSKGAVAANSAIAAPEVDYETQARVLGSPKLIAPVVRRLQAQYPTLSDAALMQNLKVTHEPGSNRLLVTYRDPDPQKVQVVLQQLAQDYLQYSSGCRTGSCRAKQLVDRRIPQLQQQVAQAQRKLQKLQQSYGNQPLNQFGQSLNQRVQANAQQRRDIQIQLTSVRARALTLQRQLGRDQTVVDRLLQQHSPYQSLLNQYQSVATQLAIELGRTQVDAANVKLLQQQYVELAQDLSKAAQSAVVQNPASLRARSTNYQTAMQLQLLQQWIDATYQNQMLTITDQALTQTDQRLKTLVKQWAGASLSYAQAQQELNAASSNLDLYQHRSLELQARQPQLSVRVVALPGS